MDYTPAVLTILDCKLSFENTQPSLVQSSQNMCIIFNPHRFRETWRSSFFVSQLKLVHTSKIIGKRQLSLAGVHKRQILQKARSVLAGSDCLLGGTCSSPSVWRHSPPPEQRAISLKFHKSKLDCSAKQLYIIATTSMDSLFLTNILCFFDCMLMMMMLSHILSYVVVFIHFLSANQINNNWILHHQASI